MFPAVCNLERRDSRYRSGRTRDWVKIKNMGHPVIERAMLIALSKRRQTAR
jgi:ATP-dependent DNA ligase